MMNVVNVPPTDVLLLTQQLIAISSYVDAGHDEAHVVEFIANFFAHHLPFLAVEKQPIAPGSTRSNLIIKGGRETKLFVLGHIDTVQPTENWDTDPLEPTIIDGKLYGLGAADMKGSLAAFLCALTKVDPRKLEHVMILLYADEEYNFKGTKRFLEDQKLSDFPPELIISLDGSLMLASGCRGLIEFDARIVGKSGHASNPANGKSAILGTTKAVENLAADIQRFTDKYLGDSTLNLAYMQGGIAERQGDQTIWLREGNVIPDSADITLEVRTSHEALNGKEVLLLFEQYIVEQGLSVSGVKLRHDYGPWDVSYDSSLVPWFENIYKQSEVDFTLSDRRLSGFIDVQMITNVVQSPTFVLGAGGFNKHGANEHVEIENLTKAEKLYSIVLNNYGDLSDD